MNDQKPNKQDYYDKIPGPEDEHFTTEEMIKVLGDALDPDIDVPVLRALPAPEAFRYLLFAIPKEETKQRAEHDYWRDMSIGSMAIKNSAINFR